MDDFLWRKVERFKGYLTESEFVEWICDEIVKAFHTENYGAAVFYKRYLNELFETKGFE